MKAAERVLGTLETIVLNDEPLPLMALSRATGLDKSTCLRIATALVDQGWLERHPTTGTFAVGARAMYLAHHLRRRNSFYAAASQLVDELRDRSEETVTLQRRHGLHRICVIGSEGIHDIRRAVPGAEPYTLHDGPSGKTILAFIDVDERSELGEEVLGRPVLVEHLDFIHARGHLSTDGDRTRDVGALSVPVFADDGIFGSLTIAGPSSRWDAERRRSFVVPMLETARHISVGLLGASGARFDGWLERAAQDVPTPTPSPSPDPPTSPT